MTEIRDVYSRITGKIIADLEQGVRPWLKPWNAENRAGKAFPSWPACDCPSKKWKGLPPMDGIRGGRLEIGCALSNPRRKAGELLVLQDIDEVGGRHARLAEIAPRIRQGLEHLALAHYNWRPHSTVVSFSYRVWPE